MPWTPPEDPRPVRAKMYVRSVNLLQWGTEVALAPVTRGEDNKAWSAATPSGECKMMVANDVAAEQFWPGQEWYVDFLPIPAEKVGQEGMED